MSEKSIYGKRLQRRDTYFFTINAGGEHSTLKYQDPIAIIFKNGIFEECKLPFSDTYSRADWQILKDIAEEIEKIEEGYKHDGV